MAKVKPEPAPVKEESFELSTESEAELSESYKDESAQVIHIVISFMTECFRYGYFLSGMFLCLQ